MSRRYRGSGHPGMPVERHPGAVERTPRHPRPESLRLRFNAVLWSAAWELARRLPEPVAFGVAGPIGRVAYRLARRARAQVRANLARVVDPDQLDATVRAAFRSYARYFVEAFRAAEMDPLELDRRTTTEGYVEHLDGALERGRGVIVLLAHHGTWDVAARWGESHGYHLAVVAEVLRPRRMFEKFVRLREAVGLDVVPLRRGDDLVRRLGYVLEANHFVGLLAERDLSGRGPVVKLFGEEARVPRGPVILSQRTGAAIVPVTMLQRPGRRWHIVALPAVDVADCDLTEGCQRVAEAIEALIRLDPAQWHAFQPVWLADRRERHPRERHRRERHR